MDFIDSFDRTRIATQSQGLNREPAVILSHFLGGSSDSWELQLDAIKNRRVVRYDTRGHGASDSPEGPYTIEMLGRDALAVLDAFELDSVDFVGVSQGAMTGMWLAANHPRRVRRLVLANTAPFIPNKTIWDELSAKALREGMEQIAESTIQGWLSDSFKQRDPQRVRRVVEVMRTMSSKGYAGNCAVLRDVDLRVSLANIRCPTLVIGGAEDGPRGAAAPTIASSVANGKLTIIPDAAHLSNIENPSAFNAAVTEFLS